MIRDDYAMILKISRINGKKGSKVEFEMVPEMNLKKEDLENGTDDDKAFIFFLIAVKAAIEEALDNIGDTLD